jgi:hypothetical protein
MKDAMFFLLQQLEGSCALVRSGRDLDEAGNFKGKRAKPLGSAGR